MGDALDDQSTSTVMPVPVKNGEVSALQEPSTGSDKELDSDVKSAKVNGDTKVEDSDGIDSSDCDTLVIDERPQNNRKRKLLSPKSGFRGFKRLKGENEYEPPMNPYFNESLFELSELHHNKNIHSLEKNGEERSEKTCANDIAQVGEDAPNSSAISSAHSKKLLGKKNKKNGSPKLREYAQYLGLQPTVQFKCSRCARAGFPSLSSLNEHHKQCRALGPIAPPTSTNATTAPSTNFRVTRKVFLCSACGTYYENWNLFLHMREVHKRFICLYCLGMFSLPEKLSLHLVSKHNCVPSQLNTEEDFFQVYKEPCFLMCCDCEKVFSERDNFFGHNCVGKVSKSSVENKSKSVSTLKHLSNQKQVTNKVKPVKSKTFVEHVTGDMLPAPNETTEEAATEKNKSENSPAADENQEDPEASVGNEQEGRVGNEQEGPVETDVTPPSENDIEDTQTQTEPQQTQTEPQQTQPEEASTNNSPVNTMETDEEVKNVKPELSSNENLDLSESSHIDAKEPESDNDLEEEEEEEEENPPSPVEPSLEAPPEITTATNTEEAVDEQMDNEELDDEVEAAMSNSSEQEDTRKVPKVTLKLPRSIATYNHEDSDDSDKLTMELDSMEGEADFRNNISDEKENKEPSNISEPQVPVAGTEIPIVELELEHPLDKFDIQLLLQKCLKATIPTCVYCNHARKIAVNGKQLGLHAIAEHRFSAVVNSITAEELIPESFVTRIKEGLPELQDIYFNLEASAAPEEGLTFSHVFECFQCRYATTVHKELYLHNRKMHAKTILLCIMCKSNFYSYSELICHLCPGLYELNNDVSFRCCMCVNDDLPSAFRLMVHLRKRHHACDVCLELCHNQSRLSNHVWKHKLHHLCYRCGIAYRNKPDITKHLFWKHGTESVLCKKCLQKKWPHVYHFCIPPSTFTCEECNLNFTKAVSLKVHKRLHNDEKPHVCTFENCAEKFISKKLLLKHEFKHREPPEETLEKGAEPAASENIESQQPLSSANNPEEKNSHEDVVKEETPCEAIDKLKVKPKVDVYDLPELNLSESDSSDSEEETVKTEKNEEEEVDEPKETVPDLAPVSGAEVVPKNENVTENPAVAEGFNVEQPAPVLENIWDDFKNYQATKEKLGTLGTGTDEVETEDAVPTTSSQDTNEENRKFLVDIIMKDHDYSMLSQEYKSEVEPEVIERTQSMDHDYCSPNTQMDQSQQQQPIAVQKAQSPPAQKDKKTKGSSSSDSSGDSDSSSCTSNCSCCSGSSDSSSSSSDSSDSDSSSSEGRRKQQARRERKKQRAKNKNKESGNSPIDVVATDNQPTVQAEQLIQESDLDTTETETDEDFYDKQPQKLASKLLAEKRKELLSLAGVGPLINGSVLESSRPSTPSLPETEEIKPRKKSKSKKKKKKSRRQEEKPLPTVNIPSTSYQYQYQPPTTVSPLTISLPKNSPLTMPSPIHAVPPIAVNFSGLTDEEQVMGSNVDGSSISDSSLRASKRRRIPNRFYGYSSDEEHERHQPPVFKWRKADLPSPARPAPSSPMIVPPITIKTIPPPVVAEEPPPVRPTINMSELRVQQTGVLPPSFQRPQPLVAAPVQEQDSGTESNESSSEEEQQQQQQPPPPPPFINKPNQPPLYCYCRCPYDEVSEMIGCDANDCMIEWFHFECVGIMVPPKGQWFCPDCRKKKQQRKELAQT